jgi:hypothetical protein
MAPTLQIKEAKFVLRYEFYESSAAVRKFRTFITCIIIKLQEKNRYCVGCKIIEPVSLSFFATNAVLHFLLKFDDNAHDKKFRIFFLRKQKIHKIHTTTHILLFVDLYKQVDAMKFERKIKFSPF